MSSSSAAATPPCAYAVAEVSSAAFVRTTVVKPRFAAWIVAVRPATPLPSTRTSVTRSGVTTTAASSVGADGVQTDGAGRFRDRTVVLVDEHDLGRVARHLLLVVVRVG